LHLGELLPCNVAKVEGDIAELWTYILSSYTYTHIYQYKYVIIWREREREGERERERTMIHRCIDIDKEVYI